MKVNNQSSLAVGSQSHLAPASYPVFAEVVAGGVRKRGVEAALHDGVGIG